MTVLEELIDAAMRICENSRASGQLQSSRSAVLLSSSGKVYVGCDVKLSTTNEAQSISAERAAFLSAIADGASQFEVTKDVISCCIIAFAVNNMICSAGHRHLQ